MAAAGIVKRALQAAAALAAAGFAVFAWIYLTLPDVRPLAKTNPATTAFMDLRAREARAAGRKVVKVQRWVPYERISSHLRRAVLVTEDAAFFSHEGIDFDEMEKSFEENWKQGKFARGGSTITQQLAKNLYLSPSRNPLRKVTEFLIARRLEAELSKRRIFELYLNVIEWGDGIWGAEAAARTYFQTTAAGLSAEQAALLAAVIINPRRYNPVKPTPFLVGRQRLILQRMGDVEPPPARPAPARILKPALPPADIPWDALRGPGLPRRFLTFRMINYTAHVHRLMADIVSRVPALSQIDVSGVLVFARLGRASTHGAYATCHSLMVPDTEPGYLFWRDRRTGHLSRRSEWFVTRAPHVRIGGRRLSHLISISLPRFCDQTLKGTRKEALYPHGPDWMAKLDTIVHELYHVDPHEGGIRTSLKADGRPSDLTHTPQFFRDVTRMVLEYVASKPDPAAYEFLSLNFDALQRRHGGITGATFRGYPAFPQRYRERLAEQPRSPRVAQIVPVPERAHRRLYTEADLDVRQFLPHGVRPLASAGALALVRAIHPHARPVHAQAAHR